MMYSSGGNTAGQLRSEQLARDQKVRTLQEQINKQYNDFGDQFYRDRANAQVKAQLPTLNQQYVEAQKNLAYELQRRGLLRSNSASTMAGSLAQQNDNARLGLEDIAQNEANDLRQNVEASRQNMLGQATSSIDPSIALSQALQSTTQFKAPSSLAPLANSFTNWANIYLTNNRNQTIANAAKQNPLAPRDASYVVR